MPNIDEEIKRDVSEHLTWDDRIDASRIHIVVENGRVQLEGSVPLYSEKRIAEEDTYSVPGVQEVDNRLQAKFPAGFPSPPDEEIQRGAETVLRLNPAVEADNIQVSCKGGQVYLEGTVRSAWQRNQAEYLVSSLRGVLLVSNQLNVVPSEEFSDNVTAEQIRSALRRNSLIDSDEVTVQVEEGIVKLSGMVPSGTAMRSAGQIALYTEGVRDVINDLKIAGRA